MTGGMTALDFAIATVLLVSTLIGIYRGFVREALSLATLAAALIVAIKFSGLPKVWLPDVDVRGYTLTGSDLQLGLMFALLFIGVLLVGRLINSAVTGTVRRSFMNLLDRMFGAVFGLARGGVAILALVFLSGLTQLPFTDKWSASLLIPWFERVERHAMCYVSDSYKNPHYPCAEMQLEDLWQ